MDGFQVELLTCWVADPSGVGHTVTVTVIG